MENAVNFGLSLGLTPLDHDAHMLERNLSIWDRIFRAVATANDGRYTLAEHQFFEIFDIRNAPALQELRPDMLAITRYDFATVLANLNHPDAAHQQLNLVDQAHLHGWADVRVLRAEIALYNGQYDKSKKLFGELFRSQKKETYEYNSEYVTLITRYQLGKVLLRMGRYKDALIEYSVFRNYAQKTGNYDDLYDQVLWSALECDLILFRLGEQELDETERRFIRATDPEHGNDLWAPQSGFKMWTQSKMAWIMTQQGRLSQAERCLRDIWDVLADTDVLGVKHPSTAIAAFRIALVLDKQGKNDEADKWLVGVRGILASSFSDAHNYRRKVDFYLSQRNR